MDCNVHDVPARRHVLRRDQGRAVERTVHRLNVSPHIIRLRPKYTDFAHQVHGQGWLVQSNSPSAGRDRYPHWSEALVKECVRTLG